MNDALVVIPTYNEKDNVRAIVARTLRASDRVDVLVVDDNSPDGTGAIADELAAADPRVRVLHRAEKNGLGGAYLAGFAWGLERGYERLVEMDADGSHHPEYLPHMLELSETNDLVLGSRWVPGGEVENWPWHRSLLSRGGNLYSRLALGIAVHDATGGFRVFTAPALRRIDLTGIASRGYCFQVDLCWRALEAGLRVVETPITFTEREFGVSKMSGNIVRESLTLVTKWGVDRRIREVKSLVLHRRRLPSVRANAHVAA
ncbi:MULTISPECIES: polyprenol monophosphomannose synthase [unclassified Curtobacterium]|uniref:polyprenol monophosphomannose synthase n=1 Tax=unclassified Curtobacterium TaxID=257496 RepID=UPI000DA77657|nr:MULTISPECIES: polyprenol monophosphomannose synthase [unclassified Curtobacterium]PZE22997.1 dolichol-phosphate mannosyltransferase [Curtobacterium sp. MCBD17_028]PZF57634.1 dolichol-phosphate mannosyltransferase [Curtobacterium sp. MCBD17_013]PZF57915.1 dolichol-phosphate mannosyltransferase [Curtobacterium sp. MCBD17_034]PZM33432.1 dolichol-phosphate mannosyltransferase [Curtobacterium sp. MCBD17_031]WIB65177.1 polyprenol monophosphomannose synthase [Curtobacterium sp. MCBD17_040]